MFFFDYQDFGGNNPVSYLNSIGLDESNMTQIYKI